jgi:hypothetical protein
MAAPVLDASTPVVKTGTGYSTTNTFTTASFTPPVGAVLIVILETNSSSGSNTLSTFACTDSLGTHLTYTRFAQFGNLVSDAQVTAWKSSAVVTSTAMTVSATFNDTATDAGSPYLLRCLVYTNADTSNPIGANGGGRGRTTNINGSAAQYLSTRGESIGYLCTSDWSQSGVPTVPGTETVDASFNVAGQDTYAVIVNASSTPTTGTTVTMTTSSPGSGLTLSWLYFEVIPALAGPSAGSVPSGTGITAGSLSAPFLFFDTGDYSPGI